MRDGRPPSRVRPRSPSLGQVQRLALHHSASHSERLVEPLCALQRSRCVSFSFPCALVASPHADPRSPCPSFAMPFAHCLARPSSLAANHPRWQPPSSMPLAMTSSAPPPVPPPRLPPTRPSTSSALDRWREDDDDADWGVPLSRKEAKGKARAVEGDGKVGGGASKEGQDKAALRTRRAGAFCFIRSEPRSGLPPRGEASTAAHPSPIRPCSRLGELGRRLRLPRPASPVPTTGELSCSI